MNFASLLRRSGLAALALLLLSESGPPARADVRLPAIFSSHMVLQQKQPNKMWGWAAPGEEVKVTVSFPFRSNIMSKSTKAGGDGKWQVTLDAITPEPDRAFAPYTIKVEGDNTIELKDVLVGEVWLCSGQSNMQMAVGQVNDADLEALAAHHSHIRLISVPQVGTQEPQDDFKGHWEVCTPDSVKPFSAVGYFFGRQLEETLRVPVGLIDDSWGGSACEAWIRRDLLAADEKYQPLLERWKKIEQNYPQAKAEYDKRLADWQERADRARAEGKNPPPRPPGPDAQMRGNARPGNIYNGVLKPTIGYGIRGVIWYQGETNAGRAYQYRDLFPLMIKSWRDEWGIGEFPFYWVQLADFMAEKPEPGDSAWAELREAQTMTMDRLPHTGQAVIIDVGEGQDIHPRNKQTVAMRLARWALARDYGIDVPCESPRYKSMEKQSEKIVLTFDHVGGGLKPFDVPEPRGFAIAGADKKFVWAKARVVGKDRDRVEVWSEDISEPVAVRYAWADNPVCNLYSRAGLPVTPFRTDDWPGVTADKN